MADFIKPIREQLREYEGYLQNDIDEFNQKLNLTRQNLFNYIDQQIEYLINFKEESDKEFNYLYEENNKTCENNQQEFDKLCLSINKNDDNQIIVSKLFEQFKQAFPIRPKMLKSIPQYHFKDIHINNFITKQNTNENQFEENSLTLSTINNKSSSPLLTKHIQLPIHSNQSPSNHLFIPIHTSIADNTQISSIASSYHKQFASQNKENDIEPQSRLISTCSTIIGVDNMVDISFKIRYEHNRTPCLICYNEEDNYLLIYSLFSHQLEYLSLDYRQICFVDLPFSEPILNLGYSTSYHLFYLTNQQTNRFVLFRLNKEKQIEIEQEIDLINFNDRLINLHMYEYIIFYLYISSSILMFGKYDLQKSSFLSSISFENKLYNEQEKSSYEIIDFTINNSFISFLIRLKNKNKFMIIVHDYYTMDKLHSFDLIDAIKPLSIISTEKKSNSIRTTTCNNSIQLLLFVNDLKSHLIHCCTYQQYLISIQINAFAICSLNDGNLALVASHDIRGLKLQDYLKTNNIQLD